jgi:tRNA pseudouridine55 synthase
MDGLLLVNKQQGISSHDVVKALRQLTRVRKIGHAGTLDPTAEGLLLACIGKATKLTPFLQELDKSYYGRMVFGVTTTTLDEEGEVLANVDASSLREEHVKSLFAQFQGRLSQVPPMHSAIHWHGERLYNLARAGTTVERAPRAVFVYDFELLQFTPGFHPVAEFLLRCSKGTYVRSLCRDVGEKTGFGAHQAFLKRTSIGTFSLDEARTLDELSDAAAAGMLQDMVLDMAEILPHFPMVCLKEGADRLVQWGRPLYLSHLREVPPTLEKGDRVRICSSGGKLLALGMALQDGLHFSKERVGFKYLRVLV